MIKKIFCLSMLIIILSMSTAQGIAGYFSNHAPDCGERDVVITAKGVQTCVDVYIPYGCYANITFYYLNWSTGWQTYAYFAYQNTTGQFCAYNTNVTCYTEGDIRTLFIWRVKAEYVCSQQNYTFTEYSLCSFGAEPCPLFYIYPDHNSTDVCPCCDAMCIGIENENGNPLNITFYRNDTMNETFYIVNRYIDVDNGTYCFCIDGHIDDMYYPMKYNETYYWYVNVTDTVTGDYETSGVYNFTTAENLSYCPCGAEAMEEKNILIVKRDMTWFFLLLAVIILGLIALKKKNKLFFGGK